MTELGWDDLIWARSILLSGGPDHSGGERSAVPYVTVARPGDAHDVSMRPLTVWVDLLAVEL